PGRSSQAARSRRAVPPDRRGARRERAPCRRSHLRPSGLPPRRASGTARRGAWSSYASVAGAVSPEPLVDRLLRDAEQRRDLLPAPPELSRAANLQLLDRLEQRAQRCNRAQADLGIAARR